MVGRSACGRVLSLNAVHAIHFAMIGISAISKLTRVFDSARMQTDKVAIQRHDHLSRLKIILSAVNGAKGHCSTGSRVVVGDRSELEPLSVFAFELLAKSRHGWRAVGF